jgi:hypothetical protein
MTVNDEYYGRITVKDIPNIVKKYSKVLKAKEASITPEVGLV